MSKFDIWFLRGFVPLLIATLGYFANEISNTGAEITSTREALSNEISNIHLTLTKDGAQAQFALFEEIIKNRAKIDLIESESKLRDGEVYREVLEYLINAKITLKE